MTDVGATWLSSYPKSGNTWLRFLLEAYRRGGNLDINDVRICTGDSDTKIMQNVSALPLKDLGISGQMLCRPAAVLNFIALAAPPIWIKTHFANIIPDGFGPCIPWQVTQRAVYVVRDPRSVLLSFSSFYGMSLEKAVDAMANLDFGIGDSKLQANQLLSSWSNHVRSWVGEKRFPVHVVKYEDMVKDTAKELTEVLEFLEQDVDPGTVSLAVDAANLSRLKSQEENGGFSENLTNKGDKFFNEGGTRWEDELGPKWIRRIEEDHGEVMQLLGYIERENSLKVVS